MRGQGKQYALINCDLICLNKLRNKKSCYSIKFKDIQNIQNTFANLDPHYEMQIYIFKIEFAAFFLNYAFMLRHIVLLNCEYTI